MTDPVARFLSENGMSNDAALHDLLTQLESDATSVRPIPSPELVALMATTRRSSVVHRHRGALTALIVVGALGVGVTAAAASPDVRTAAQQIFQTVTGAVRQTTDPAINRESPTTPSEKPKPNPAQSAHPNASDHPVPSDHPGNTAGSSHATPNPASTSPPDPENGKSTSAPGRSGGSHKP
jgi:hypothetical protein